MVTDVWSAPDVDAGLRGGHARAARAIVCIRRFGPAATCLLATLLLLAVVLPQPGEGQILHVYDRMNRLRATVDPAANDAGIWTYDAVGNVLTITRQPATQTTILEIPAEAIAGDCGVRILGIGFSTTPGQNTVTVNGVAATVQSATAIELVVCLPVDATTGPIVVTNANGSATSSGAVSVSAVSPAPTVIGFTPTIGLPGTALTVSGTNFETAPISNNTVTFNLTRSPVTSATGTSLSTTVPTQAGSGRIAVATPFGTAVSAADFFIVTLGLAVPDIEITGRMVIGETRPVALSGLLKAAILVFDGTAGQQVSMLKTNITGGRSNLFLLNPDGTNLGVAQGTLEFLDGVTLPVTGTYTIVAYVIDSAPTTFNLTLYGFADVPGTITIDGAPVTVTTTVPGQNARLTFGATAGQGVGVEISSAIPSRTVSILLPTGAVVGTTGVGTATFLDTVPLPLTGTYILLADPAGVNTGSLTLSLRGQPADLTGTITPGGAPVAVVVNAPLQNARLTFPGSAGQRVSLRATNVTISESKLSIINPDGSTLVGPTTVTSAGGLANFIDATTLPTTGTYTILLDPVWLNTGSVTLTLYNVPPDLSGTISFGVAKAVTIATPGQNAAYSFTGNTGQRVSVFVTGSTFGAGGAPGVEVGIATSPTCCFLTSIAFDGSQGEIGPLTLPTNGTYYVIANPAVYATGSLTVTIYSVPADPSQKLNVNGQAKTVSTTTPGQKAKFTFSGSTGQSVTVQLTNNTMGCVWVRLYRPNSFLLSGINSCGASITLGPQTLLESGTHTIEVDPDFANVGSIRGRVTSP